MTMTTSECIQCIHCDYDYGEERAGMGGYILCEKDEEGELDLGAYNYAPRCLFSYDSRKETKSSIRQFALAEMPYNCWRLNTDVIPPEGIQVLCSSACGELWLDTIVDGKWRGFQSFHQHTTFAWQAVATPSIF